jgi:hypothetical protein
MISKFDEKINKAIKHYQLIIISAWFGNAGGEDPDGR